jgi:hypothetical protein
VPDSEEGWTLIISKLDTGAILNTKTFNDLYVGTYNWLVPVGTYSASESNKLKVLLRNELINQDDDDLFVVGVGMIDDIPSKPTFKIIAGDAPFIPGEQISVEVSALKTTYDIAGFWVSVSYETSAGTTTEYIINSKWYAATKTATGGECVVTFTFPSAGYVRMEASAADVMNLNSGNSELSWTIYEPGAEPPAKDFGGFDVTGLLIAVGLIVLALVIFAKAPLPEYIKWIVVLALLAVAGYFAFGVIESLESGG